MITTRRVRNPRALCSASVLSSMLVTVVMAVLAVKEGRRTFSRTRNKFNADTRTATQIPTQEQP